MNAPRWKIWAAVAGLLLIGGALGAVATVAVIGRVVRHEVSRFGRDLGGPERMTDRLHTRLVRELDLDAAQAAQARQALEKAATSIQASRGQLRQEMRGALRTAFAEISHELTPPQRTKFRAAMQGRLKNSGLGADAELVTAPLREAP
jgi:Spy/CpxP family protein refolding chaperone